MIELEIKRLKNLLAWSGVVKASKPTIDIVELEFTENGCLVRQMDYTEMVAVVHKFRDSFFNKYEPLGSVQLPVSSLLKAVKTYFKTSSTVSLDFTEDKLIVRTVNETYSELRPRVELKKIEKNFLETEHGLIMENMEVVKKFLVDSSELNVKGADVVSLNFGETLELTISTETYSYSKKVPVIKKEGGGSGQVSVDADYLSTICKNVSGALWVMLPKEGPLIIGQSSKDYVLTYYLALRVE